MQTNFTPPKVSFHKLIKEAQNNATSIELERGWTSNDNDLWNVVNLLRHEYSDYDVDQSFDRYISIMTQIAHHYPKLISICLEQIKRRLNNHLMADKLYCSLKKQQEEEKIQYQIWNDKNNQRINEITVGQQSKVKYNGRTYDCVVVAKFKRKVQVCLTLKSGIEKNIDVWATQVL